jgi:hypothetical protein
MGAILYQARNEWDAIKYQEYWMEDNRVLDS